jgi:hypothetical protein
MAFKFVDDKDIYHPPLLMLLGIQKEYLNRDIVLMCPEDQEWLWRIQEKCNIHYRVPLKEQDSLLQ